MDGHIKHLHCHYRVRGNRDSAPQVSSRLSRVLKDDLLDAYENAMDQIVGDDPAVIVIRQINSRLAVGLDDYPNDHQLAERWGGRLAGNIVRRIAAANEADEGLIRFTDQAEYVASYLSDLINEQVKHRWYYGAFNYLKDHSTGEAIYQVLTDNRCYLGKTLSLLHQRGLLQRTLNSVDRLMLKRLWFESVRQQPFDALSVLDSIDSNLMTSTGQTESERSQYNEQNKSSAENVRTNSDLPTSSPELDIETDQQLFEQALNLLRRLSLMPEQGLDIAQLMDRFHPVTVVDWRDQTSLTTAFCEIIGFLQTQHQYRLINLQASPDVLLQLDKTLAEFDWLEITQLRTQILQNTTTRQTNLLSASSLTPRQQDLINALTQALDQTTIPGVESGESIALQLYTQLLEYQPRWTDDELAKRLIEALALSHVAFSNSGNGSLLRGSLRAGQLNSVVKQLKLSAQNNLQQGLQLIIGMGDSAIDLLDNMAGDHAVGRQTRMVISDCAGVFLLLRAIADIRLTLLIKEYPGLSIENLLLSILIAIAGKDAINKGELDAGLSELVTSGRTSVNQFEALKLAWQVADEKHHDAFQYTVLNMLVGQRLINGDRLSLYLLQQEDGTGWMIGGDAEAQVWPLGCSITDKNKVEKIMSDWIDAWTQATGRTPELSVDASLVQFSPSDLTVDAVDEAGTIGKIDKATATKTANDSVVLHAKGRENLLQALTALTANQFGLARVDIQCALLANNIIRLWARWFNHFSTASTPYLLDNLIRRTGLLQLSEDCIEVQMDSAPLDVVIEMAGYLNDLERLDWLGGRTIKYRIRR